MTFKYLHTVYIGSYTLYDIVNVSRRIVIKYLTARRSMVYFSTYLNTI